MGALGGRTMAATLQQPDFHQLDQHLANVVEQIRLLLNMSAMVGVEAIILNLQEQHDQALTQQAEQHQQLIKHLDALWERWVLCSSR